MCTQANIPCFETELIIRTITETIKIVCMQICSLRKKKNFYRQLQIPEFRKLVEKNLSLDPDAIKNIKQVLTLLEYTTIQSVSKLSKRREMPALEL